MYPCIEFVLNLSFIFYFLLAFAHVNFIFQNIFMGQINLIFICVVDVDPIVSLFQRRYRTYESMFHKTGN